MAEASVACPECGTKNPMPEPGRPQDHVRQLRVHHGPEEDPSGATPAGSPRPRSSEGTGDPPPWHCSRARARIGSHSEEEGQSPGVAGRSAQPLPRPRPSRADAPVAVPRRGAAPCGPRPSRPKNRPRRAAGTRRRGAPTSPRCPRSSPWAASWASSSWPA